MLLRQLLLKYQHSRYILLLRRMKAPDVRKHKSATLLTMPCVTGFFGNFIQIQENLLQGVPCKSWFQTCFFKKQTKRQWFFQFLLKNFHPSKTNLYPPAGVAKSQTRFQKLGIFLLTFLRTLSIVQETRNLLLKTCF